MGRIHANGAHKIYMRDIDYLIYTLTLGGCDWALRAAPEEMNFVHRISAHIPNTSSIKTQKSIEFLGLTLEDNLSLTTKNRLIDDDIE